MPKTVAKPDNSCQFSIPILERRLNPGLREKPQVVAELDSCDEETVELRSTGQPGACPALVEGAAVPTSACPKPSHDPIIITPPLQAGKSHRRAAACSRQINPIQPSGD
jgi:hypothetical protein